MNKNKKIANAALASVLALGSLAVTTHANAASTNYEKCYGVAAAGKNDCGTVSSACAGTVKQANACYAWIFTPKGICEKIAGSSVGNPAEGCKGPDGKPVPLNNKS